MVGEKGLLDLVAMHVQGWANAASAAANSTAQLARAQTKTKLAHQFHHQLAGMAIQIATGLALRACNRLAMRAGGMHTVLATAICRLHARIQVHAAAGLMLLASTRGVSVPSYGDVGQDDTQTFDNLLVSGGGIRFFLSHRRQVYHVLIRFQAATSSLGRI